MSNINDFFHFTLFWDFVWAHFCIRKNRAFRRSASYALHSRWFSPKSFCPASKVFLTIKKKRLALAPRERLRRGYNPLRVFFTQIAWLPPPIPSVIPNFAVTPSFAVIPNFSVIPILIRDLYKIAPKCCSAPKNRLARTFVSGTMQPRQRSLNKNPSLCKAAGNQFSDILHAIAMVYGCSGRQVLLHKKMCGEEGGMKR